MIRDIASGTTPFITKLIKNSGWVPLTINTIINITTDNGWGFSHLLFDLIGSDNAILDGAGHSTFYIKYLHP